MRLFDLAPLEKGELGRVGAEEEGGEVGEGEVKELLLFRMERGEEGEATTLRRLFCSIRRGRLGFEVLREESPAEDSGGVDGMPAPLTVMVGSAMPCLLFPIIPGGLLAACLISARMGDLEEVGLSSESWGRGRGLTGRMTERAIL